MWMVVTTGAIIPAKLQSNHHHQQTNTQLFTGRMSFLSPNQQAATLNLYISTVGLCAFLQSFEYQSTEGKAHKPTVLIYKLSVVSYSTSYISTVGL